MAAPLVPVVNNPKSKKQTFAEFSPPLQDFDQRAFPTWLDEGGRDYLQIDPYTVDGLKEILEFSGIDESEILWDERDVHELYAQVLTLVQKTGRPGDWTMSAEEGLHRLTASIIRTLACKLDVSDAIIRPDTIEAKDFIDNDVVTVGRTYNLDADAFRKIMYGSTFYYKKKEDDESDPKKARLINASVSYFKEGGINGCEASYRLRSRSYATSLNKKDSVIRCPLGLMGEFMGKFISNITMDQATRRVKFNKVNPSNIYKKEVSHYEAYLETYDDDFDKAFPLSKTLEHEDYKSYLEDPFKEGSLENALNLFSFRPLEDEFHVPDKSVALEEVKKTTPPDTIRPPFLPSIESNTIDVGKEFSKNSKFNPDTVNAAILAPTVYAYIMSAYTGKSLPDVIRDKTRIEHLDYYLRFHNGLGDCSPIKKVHAAFACKYQQSDTKGYGLCYKSTVMLGMLDFVLTIFNSYLSIEAENGIEKKWEDRQAHFKEMAIEFGHVFSSIGYTSKGSRDYPSVITILGTSFSRSFGQFFSYCKFSSNNLLTPCIRTIFFIL